MMPAVLRCILLLAQVGQHRYPEHEEPWEMHQQSNVVFGSTHVFCIELGTAWMVKHMQPLAWG